MFKPRRIETSPDWLDPDGVKLYTVSANGEAVLQPDYLAQLQTVKSQKQLDWEHIPAFAIFHEGANAQYLVLAWWRSENEMFTSVSVREQSSWVIDSDKYSFCLWDLEILWAERNIYIETMYSGKTDLAAYRYQRLSRSRETWNQDPK
ncbi:MAG: hypothetical protein AAF152_19880 [Cyanobacteria bacterium P01_A01_bin.114]